MPRSPFRVFCFLTIVCLVTTSVVRGGNINFTVSPGIVHAVSHDAGVIVILVSGEAAVLDDASGQPTSKFTLDRVPLIQRSDPKAWHNIPIDRWLKYFTKPMKAGTPITINCIGADPLRDSRNALQAVYCISIAPTNWRK